MIFSCSPQDGKGVLHTADLSRSIRGNWLTAPPCVFLKRPVCWASLSSRDTLKESGFPGEVTTPNSSNQTDDVPTDNRGTPTADAGAISAKRRGAGETGAALGASPDSCARAASPSPRSPIEQACRIALETVRAELLQHPEIEQVVFVCFSEHDRLVYANQLNALS